MAPSIPVEIEKKHIDGAIERAKAGVSKEDSYYYADKQTKGLQLRVQSRQAFWALKYFNWTRTIGYAWPAEDRHLPSISEARKLAAACKDILDDDPKMLEPMLVKYYGRSDRDIKKAKKEMSAVSTGWTVLRTAEEMITARQQPDTDEPIKPATIAQFRYTLKRPELKELVNKPISDVTKGDLDAVKRELDKMPEHATTAVKKFVSDIRRILTWGATHATDTTGLDPSNLWWQLVKSGKKTKPVTRTPEVDDLVKTLILAEEYLKKPLPGRASDGRFGIGQNVLNALWWLCLSAQRATAGTQLRVIDFFPDPERRESGWYLAFWEETKNGKAFVLPVPPRAVTFLLSLISKNKGNHSSQWCFPSSKGDAANDIPIDRNSPGAFIERLATVDTPTRTRIKAELKKDEENRKKKGKEYEPWVNPFVDLLAEHDVMYWSPHDVRRGLTAVMKKHDIPGGASAVLAHEVDVTADLRHVDNARNRERWLELRVAKVTELAYGAGGFIPLKGKAMEIWTNTILDRYEELSPEAQVRKAERGRIVTARYIFRDANDVESTVEPAKIYAEQKIAKQRAVVEQRERIVQSFLADEPINLSAVAFAKEMLAEAEDELDRLSTAALIEGSEQARGSASLFKIINEDRFDFDYRKKAPDWIAIRNNYVLGRITIEELKAKVGEVYGLDFSDMSAGIFLPGRGPSTLGEGTVSKEEELAMRAEERKAMGLQ
ncbi:hypothetical protein ASG42_11280 [Rhizobium sp. Leaf391]|uniref:hypothetical protein n=1 Tax=Rhizobium sp. Leaf391 TaxID=1736360 RepID=UPI0007159DF1|nr:hypothetical protein [Rhizobium sp. Leaf391]KQS91066.1 hypothetical protein ASG42_11280 [Rhizobium sp. Leaf391]